MSAAGRLLLVRHGRTAGNAAGRRMGRQDLPLDEMGREQARALAGALAVAVRGGPLAQIHSSPLQRARQTIAPFAEAAGAPVALEPDLMEMDFGAGGGGAEPGRKLRVKSRHLYVPLPGGESLHQVSERCERFLATVLPALRQGACVVTVAHYRVNQLLAGLATATPFEETVAEGTFRPTNASVHELRFPLGGGPATGPALVWSPPDDAGRHRSAPSTG